MFHDSIIQLNINLLMKTKLNNYSLLNQAAKQQQQQQQKTVTSSVTSSGPQPRDQLHLRLPNVTVHSYDDLSSSELVAGGHFGRATTSTTTSTTTTVSLRRPSIFRRCYSSESSVLVSNLHTTSSVVACTSSSSTDAADALVDCLPPHYWQAKHMPRLIKVSGFSFFLFFFQLFNPFFKFKLN